jgi:hypothetical protein
MTHGTEAGYRIHLKNGEQACGHCLWAHRVYNKSRYDAKKVQRAAKPKLVKVVLHGTPQALALHALERSPVCTVCLTAACDWEHRQTRRYLREAS